MSNPGVLTTGQVARICRVAPRTVSKWFDRGELSGYKIPGSRDRRIPLRTLVEFMRRHNIPMDEIETELAAALVVCLDDGDAETIASSLRHSGTVTRARSAVEAGMHLAKYTPDVVFVNPDDVDPSLIAAAVAQSDLKARIVLFGPGASGSQFQADARLPNLTDAKAVASAATLVRADCRAFAAVLSPIDERVA